MASSWFSQLGLLIVPQSQRPTLLACSRKSSFSSIGRVDPYANFFCLNFLIYIFSKMSTFFQCCRYPFLQIIGFQNTKIPLHSSDICTHLFRRTLREYISFPILLSNKDVLEVCSHNLLLNQCGSKDLVQSTFFHLQCLTT